MNPRTVIGSREDGSGMRCVDIIRVETRFAFKEYRKDAENGGRWTLVTDYSCITFPTLEDAERTAAAAIP